MNVKLLIDRIADRADDFLDGVTSREQARAGISEMITMEQVAIAPDDRTRVIDGVMQLLDREGFFDGLCAGGRPDEDAGEDDED